MKDNEGIELNQLLTRSEVAREKKMDRELVRYHLTRPGAPKAIPVGVNEHPFYLVSDVEAWEPKREPKKRRKKPKA